MDFASQIIKWYYINQRSLPWRSGKNPYQIWLSEVILQQTQVVQGLAYYQRFVDEYPTIHDLANATEDEVLKNWEGLGYYSRARNLHSTAKHISKNLNGEFPNNYDGLIQLKGVGDYTASAIASFAFGERKAVLDGNVFRVLSRYFDVDEDISSGPGKRKFKQLSQEILPIKDSDTYNQSIMELGSLVCTKHKPKCLSCPVQTTCLAFNNDTVQLRPVKLKKIKKRIRFFNFLFMDDGEHTLLEKRDTKGIWGGLYQFPLVESSELLSPDEIKQNDSFPKCLTLELISYQDFKHLLTHQTIHARLFHFSCSQIEDVRLIKQDDLEKYALPKLMEKFVAHLKE